MSHWSNGSLPIESIDELEAACAAVGLETVRGGMARGFSGARTHGELVIRGDGGYDVAVNMVKGKVTVTADNYGFRGVGGYTEWLTRKGVFSQATALRTVAGAPKGLKWTSVVEEDGATVITIQTKAAGGGAFGGGTKSWGGN